MQFATQWNIVDTENNTQTRIRYTKFNATSIQAAKSQVTRSIRNDTKLNEMDWYKDIQGWSSWTPHVPYKENDTYTYSDKKSGTSFENKYLWVALVWKETLDPESENVI